MQQHSHWMTAGEVIDALANFDPKHPVALNVHQTGDPRFHHRWLGEVMAGVDLDGNEIILMAPAEFICHRRYPAGEYDPGQPD